MNRARHGGADEARVLRLVLRSDQHVTRVRRLARSACDGRHQVFGRAIEDLLRGVEAQPGQPGGEEAPGTHRLADPGTGVLLDPEPRPPLPLGEAPVGAVLVGDPGQPRPPPCVEAGAQR